jgi:hypothetical protein
MSAAAVESGSKTRRSRSQDQSDDSIDTTMALPADAVADLMKGYVRTVTALLPTAAVRPTVAVDAAFDLAEQLLTLTRQAVREAVSMMESDLDQLDKAA